MARLYQCGFELKSTTAGVEFSSSGLNGGGIVTSPVRGGTAAMQINVAASFSWFGHVFKSALSNSEAFCRVYVYFNTFPAVTTEIISAYDASGASQQANICITSAGVLQLRQTTPTGTQIGANSTALKLKTWYLVEMDVAGGTGSATLRGRLALDGGPITQFASSTTATVGTFDAFYLGNPGTSSTFNVLYDDWAINDTSGSNQTSYPGHGSIVHLKPSAAGDSNGFTVQVGGTAGAANNFTRVNEVTPDDATSYNGAALLNAEDLFNCDNFTGGAFSSINVVAVGVRFADLVSGDATTGVKLEIEKTASGTKSQSANLIPNSTSFLTNAAATPKNYPLVTYNDPDGVPWGQSTLDSMQVGYINDTVGVQTVAISTVWVSIDFTSVQYGTTTSVSSTSSTSSSISTTSSSTSSTSTSASTTSASTSSTSSSISTSSTSSSVSSTSSSMSSTSSSSTSASTSISSTSSSISSTSMSSTSQSSTSSSTSISSTSSSFSSTSSSVSSTSSSVSSTSFSSTSSSSSTSTTTIPSNLDYSYQDTLTLPTTSTDDIDPDSNKNVQNVAVDDGDYFVQYGSEYMIQEYKKKWINNTDTPRFTWKGRSTESTLVSPFVIQIYNVNSSTWETICIQNKVPADTDFQLTDSQSTNVSNYYDSNNIVTFRTYQQVI